jgi:hypothetical protein
MLLVGVQEAAEVQLAVDQELLEFQVKVIVAVQVAAVVNLRLAQV